MNQKRFVSRRARVIAPGVIHVPLGGGNECWSLLDGSYTARAKEDCAWNAEEPELDRALRWAGLPGDSISLNVLPLLVRWSGRLILIDPGCAHAYGPNLGQLPVRLKALGVEPEQINEVWFSHLHLDHVAGALGPDGSKAYPNAEYRVPKGEWEFWIQSEPDLDATQVPRSDRAALVAGIHRALDALRPHVHFFEGGETLRSGVIALPFPGHTPGQVGFEFRGGQEEGGLVYVADALVEPSLHVPHPEWTLIGDTLPDVVLTTRLRLLDAAAAEGTLVSGYHFPLPGFGVIRERAQGRFEYVPLPWDFGF